MKNALATAAGCLAGFALPWLAGDVITPFVHSGELVMVAGSSRLLHAVSAPERLVVATSTLAALLGLPLLLLAVAEAANAGRSPRRAAVLVLASLAGVAVAFAGTGVGPLVATALVAAVLLAVAPGAWASVPLALGFGAVAGAWAAQVATNRAWLAAPTAGLAATCGGAAGTWLVVLTVLQGVILAGCVVRSAAPARRS